MILIPELLATLLGLGLEQFVQSKYGLLGLLLLAAFTVFWSAKHKSTLWAAVGTTLFLLALTQA